MHATLTGLELIRQQDQLFSLWYRENRGFSPPVDLQGFLTYLRRGLPEFQLGIGGYRENGEYGFRSRGEHPYLRSFSFQGPRAVLIGWPIHDADVQERHSEQVFQIRRELEQYQLCHKWHRDGYRDNDCYLVLGKVEPHMVSPDRLAGLTEMLRRRMAEERVMFPCSRRDLSIVHYTDTELSLAGTRVLSSGREDFAEDIFLKELEKL